MFRQVRNGSAGDAYDLDEEGPLAKSRSHSRRIVSEFDKKRLLLREKEDRRQKYAKYVKEINLPLELDRKEIKKEASRMEQERQGSLGGRLTANPQQRKLNKHLLPPISQNQYASFSNSP